MSNINDPRSVLSAIENLTSKRHVISEAALKAKEDLANHRQETHDNRQLEVDKRWDKKLAIIEEFNESVTLLMSIFQNSQFDELALFAANPARVMITNFMIGILRGIGFAIGFLLIVLVALIAIKQALPAGSVSHAIHLLQNVSAQ